MEIILEKEKEIGFKFWRIWFAVGVTTCLSEKENNRYQRIIYQGPSRRNARNFINNINFEVEWKK